MIRPCFACQRDDIRGAAPTVAYIRVRGCFSDLPVCADHLQLERMDAKANGDAFQVISMIPATEELTCHDCGAIAPSPELVGNCCNPDPDPCPVCGDAS